MGRAPGLTCVIATPEIASSPPTTIFGVMRSPRNNTLEIKANTGSSRPNGATRPMEQRAISQNRAEDLVRMDWGREFLAARDPPFSLSASAGSADRAGALRPDRAGS